MADARHIVAVANRILVNEGVLDAFGHVSIRDPANPRSFLLARSLAPELVESRDVLAFDLQSQPLQPTESLLYSERVIHGAIYRARPDVNAICHHHAPAVMPFCLTDARLRVVNQLGATIGTRVPVWDQRDEFGTTNHLVRTQEEGVSLARCLGDASLVLMKRHGATVVGADIRELTFRSIYSVRNAEAQARAMSCGEVDAFTDGEIELAGRFADTTLTRAWGLWCARVSASPESPQ
jgi:ribulose-5-phosphate 4-epimerase/fuculose-1-phosphate aldolase